MNLPGVFITNTDGALITVEALADGICGIVLSSDVAPSGLALATAKKVSTIAEVKALGIDEAFDSDNSVHAYSQMSEFFLEGGEGSEIWLMVLPQTLTMEDICDPANEYAKKLIDSADGEIRLLGVTRVPDATYTPTYTKGLDDDVMDALIKLQSLASNYEAAQIPFVGILEGRDYQGTAADLENLREASYNHCAVMIAGSGATEAKEDASVGALLGRLAKIPVQRKASRVKDGAVALSKAYLTDGTEITGTVANNTELKDLHTKGFIALRRFNGKTGLFFTSDPIASSGDYNMIGRRRVINKARMIAYITYLQEVDDDLEVDANGRIAAPIIKSWQAKIVTAINLQMGGDNGEISSVRCVLDPLQDIISTNKVAGKIYITPKGYSSEIEMDLGFENPALSN